MTGKSLHKRFQRGRQLVYTIVLIDNAVRIDCGDEYEPPVDKTVTNPTIRDQRFHVVWNFGRVEFVEEYNYRRINEALKGVDRFSGFLHRFDERPDVIGR